jgi:hypothetical protein
MSHRLLGLLIIATWASAVVAFLYSSERRIPYLVALRICGTWAATVVGFMLFNFWLADTLQMPHGSSGYVRGRNVISAYGFLVQLLLILEIGAILVTKNYLKSRRRYMDQMPSKDAYSGKTDLQAKAPIPPSISEPQADISKPEPAYEVTRTFGLTGGAIFFLCCAVGNFWLGVKALERSLYGFFFVIVGVGLLAAAFNASNKPRIRRK